MKLTLQIVPEWINDWCMLDNVLKDLVDLHNIKEVELDFFFLYDIQPKSILMILTISNKIYLATNSKITLINLHLSVFSYLEKIKFLSVEMFNIDTNSLIWEDEFERPFYDSVIEITQITSPEEKTRLVADIKELLEMWFPEDKYRSLKHSTLSSLMELCGNSLEHSHFSDALGQCFVMMQKNVISDYIEVNLVTADVGVGIKSHQERKYGVLYESDHKYINKALNGTSGRMDDTGGFGLQTIQILIKENNGELSIRSGKGNVVVSEEVTYHEGLFSTPGTQCSITLRKPLNEKLTTG